MEAAAPPAGPAGPALFAALPRELLVRILSQEGVGGAELSRCASVCRAWRRTERGQRPRLWQGACARHGMQQVGTRRRGWKCWRELFISLCCVECVVPAAHIFNLAAGTTPPGVLRWTGSRVPLCARCCRGFHDFPRTRARWERAGLEDPYVHANFRQAVRKRALVEGLHLRPPPAAAEGGGGRAAKRRRATSGGHGGSPAVVDLT